MKVLLAQQSAYMPTHGGANKANRLLLESLVCSGHSCHALGPSDPSWHPSEEGLTAVAVGASLRFEAAGVAVTAVTERASLLETLRDEILSQDPDWVIVSSEDPGQQLLDGALSAAPGRVIYMAHTTLVLPFGPGGFVHSEAKTDLLARCAGIATVSRFMKDYIRDHGGLDSVVFQPPLYGAGPYPLLSDFENGAVTLINPCVYKGLPLFTELARARPDLPFAAIPTWGTTDEDRALLADLDNVRILPPRDRIDEIFAQTRVLLVPSLWHEAFGRVCVEAMLRGIPVMAADVGGLPEAMLGVDHVLPVRPITGYLARFDRRGLPLADAPAQDPKPWLEALDRLTGDRDHYETVASSARVAAHAYLDNLSLEPFSRYLETSKPGEIGRRSPTHAGTDSHGADRLAGLTPAQRALLARRLKSTVGVSPR